ncbi:MAG: DUF1802 family protein [Nitrososphaera sp.]|jgi:hypothetical protein
MRVQALKEWAIVCRALGTGRQVVLLRKGGIMEYRQGFQVKHDRFLLYPTFEHQDANYIQGDYRHVFEAEFSGSQIPRSNHTTLEYYAEVAEVKEISDKSVLPALEPFHIWTESYVNARMEYNPSKPMSVLLLRIYRLASPVAVDPKPEWAGCKSWLPVDIELESAVPVMDEHDFSRVASKVRRVLSVPA